MRYAAVVVLAAGMASNASAQSPPRAIAEGRAVERKVQATRVGVESRITKGAPYAAEAVTESTQVLGDGNRIVTKNTARVYRDSDGRTRREQLDQNATEPWTISISDPVAGIAYVLDPPSRQAFQNGVMIATAQGVATTTARPATGGGVIAMRSPEVAVTVAGPEQAEKMAAEVRARSNAEAAVVAGGAGGEAGVFTYVAPGLMAAKFAAEGFDVRREDLGQQTIEGVMATGTRTTTEIPAGKIGNEQPIKIVSEQWYSPDLQVLVLTKHSDPRVGETIYHLTAIVRAEQARSLFEVPSDYTVRESEIRRLQK